jgi:isoleucyl-tRNA synthetase
MTKWPEVHTSRDNASLLREIGVVQKVVGLARAARGLSGLRTRQPLSRLLVRAPDDAAARALEEHKDQILEELNVKAIEFIARDAGLVSYRIKPNLPRIGRRYGKLIPAIARALQNAEGSEIAGAVARSENVSLRVDDQEIVLDPEDVLIETSSAAGYACAEDSGYLTAFDTTLDEDLRREGIARELIRTVQDARKLAGLDVSDRIVLGVSGSSAVGEALERFRDYLMSETLAVDWMTGQSDPLFRDRRSLDEHDWTIEISRAG